MRRYIIYIRTRVVRRAFNVVSFSFLFSVSFVEKVVVPEDDGSDREWWSKEWKTSSRMPIDSRQQCDLSPRVTSRHNKTRHFSSQHDSARANSSASRNDRSIHQIKELKSDNFKNIDI